MHVFTLQNEERIMVNKINISKMKLIYGFSFGYNAIFKFFYFNKICAWFHPIIIFMCKQ